MKVISLNLSFIAFGFSLLLAQSLHADSNPNPQKSIFDLMHYKEVLEMTIEIDMEELQYNRRNQEYMTAGVWFEDANGKKQAWRIKAKQRGKFRRMNCAMPPLKLNFKKAELAVAGLAQFDDLKLVTHCIENKVEAKKLLVREHLSYRLYNALTDASFRTQLVRITYKDINTGKKTKQYGIIIEDLAQVRSRMNAKKLKREEIQVDQINKVQLQQVALFQYMIGNADWGIHAVRNIKMVKKGNTIEAIPYDFDFAGLVNAPYAIPNPNYYLASVGERVYLGLEKNGTELAKTLAIFRAKQDTFHKVIKSSKQLAYEDRKEMLNYIDSFFQNTNDVQFAADKLKKHAAAVSQ